MRTSLKDLKQDPPSDDERGQQQHQQPDDSESKHADDAQSKAASRQRRRRNRPTADDPEQHGTNGNSSSEPKRSIELAPLRAALNDIEGSRRGSGSRAVQHADSSGDDQVGQHNLTLALGFAIAYLFLCSHHCVTGESCTR
jgi:hypothetical protein